MISASWCSWEVYSCEWSVTNDKASKIVVQLSPEFCLYNMAKGQ